MLNSDFFERKIAENNSPLNFSNVPASGLDSRQLKTVIHYNASGGKLL